MIKSTKKSIMLSVLSLLLISCLFLMAACGGGSETTTEETTTTDNNTAAPETIKIGVIYALSGASAPTGLDQKSALELGAELVNNAHSEINLPFAETEGIPSLNGAKIEFIFADSEGSPEKGTSEAERLINQEGVVALMGCYQSSVAATASQVAERAGIPFFVVESSSPTLTDRGFKYIFRQGPHDKIFGEYTFKFLNEVKDKYDINSIAMIYENTAFGTDSAASWTENAEAGGYEILESIAYPNKTTSMNSEAQRLIAAKPDVILAASYVSDATLLMKTFKEMNYTPNLIAQDAGFVEQGYFDMLGADAEYTVTREAYCSDFGEINENAKKIGEMFKEQYGVENLNGNTARAVQAAFVIADALNRAASTDPQAIRDALAATDLPSESLIMPWEGLKFDETGQNEKVSVLICQVQGGKYVTVWPEQFATAELVWPYPAWNER